MENNRGQWGSNFGFLMAAIGSAVGLGNIWGFPYKMGANGGGAFLLVYLVLVVLVGFAVMLGELVIGRKTGLGAVGAYQALAKKYTWLGYMGVASGFLIVSFYCVVGGLVLKYALTFLTQMFGAAGFGDMASFDAFAGFCSSKYGLLCYFFIFMALNVIIVRGGIKGGIEKFTSIAMPSLLAILLFIVGYIAFQPGAIEGYKFMFLPDFELLKTDFFSILKVAAGQMFFSLSLGMGCMITYGSYLGKHEKLQKNTLIIPIADTCFALLAGMAVMPACAAFGVDYGKGAGLLFVTMHDVFMNSIGGFWGNLIGFLMFFLVFIAALTSSISLLEVCTAFIIDKRIEKGLEPNRKKYALLAAVLAFVLGLPCAFDGLGFGGIIPAGPLGSWDTFYDLIAEGILMPIGAAVMSILIGWKLKTSMVKSEVEATPGVKMWGYGFFDICFKFVVPIIMVVVLYGQLETFGIIK